MKFRPPHLAFIAIALALGVGVLISKSSTTTLQSVQQGTTLAVKPAYAAGSQEAFNYLSTTNSATRSYCGLQQQTVDSFSNEDFIEGSCCGAMDFHRYQEQVEGLKKYSNTSQIPEDPYNIPTSLAQELFEYQKSIALTTQQQVVYDQAMEMSDEGGPCCCRCWRWTAFEGQAKYLITQEDFTAEQIAQVWGLEDGCGGAGHTHDA